MAPQSTRWTGWQRAAPLAAIAVALAAPASPAGWADPAGASFPGQPGVIAFSSNRASQGAENYDIFTIAPGGSNPTRLTDDPAHDFSPAWTADGAVLAFVSDRSGAGYDIWTMAADGSGERLLLGGSGAQTDPAWFPGDPQQTAIAYTNADNSGEWDIYVAPIVRGSPFGSPVRLTTHPAIDYDPAVSPDGTRIAFTSWRDGTQEIYVMRADQPEGPANPPVRLTKNRRIDVHPDWSPDGRRIAFNREGDVFTMRADGSGQTNLTRNRRGSSHTPSWSPDGRRIAFIHHTSGSAPWNLYRMDRDGGRRARLTDDAFVEDDPAWQPRRQE